jgi:hypothetical protein
MGSVEPQMLLPMNVYGATEPEIYAIFLVGFKNRYDGK